MVPVAPKLIVGLGNPGEQYADTRHNVGFAVVDALVSRLSRVREQHTWASRLFTARFAGRTIHLMKPLTYMNRSGEAVNRAVRALKLTPPEVLVVVDCLDLPFGRLRMRTGGGSGGHRGMESVVAQVGTNSFPRLRVGIGRSSSQDVVDFVLDPWSPDERAVIDTVTATAADAVLTAVRAGVERAMNAYNSWKLNAEQQEPEGKES